MLSRNLETSKLSMLLPNPGEVLLGMNLLFDIWWKKAILGKLSHMSPNVIRRNELISMLNAENGAWRVENARNETTKLN